MVYYRKKHVKGYIYHEVAESCRKEGKIKKKLIVYLGHCPSVPKALECARGCGDEKRAKVMEAVLPKVRAMETAESRIRTLLNRIRAYGEQQRETQDEVVIKQLYEKILTEVRELVGIAPDRVRSILNEEWPGLGEHIDGLLKDAQKA